MYLDVVVSFFFQAEDGIRARTVTGVQACALPIPSPSRRRDGEAGDAAVPLRVREHVGTVLRLDDTRILDSPGPLVLPLRVRVGIQHGRAAAREAQSIRALRQPDT